jgi:hypothetical protein
MRGDLQIDGFGIGHITVGGMDATDGVLDLYRSMERTDINLLLLNGCVISLFNMVDLGALFEELSIPIICVTYEESEGLERYLEELEDAGERLKRYRGLGERTPVELHTGHTVLVRYMGIGTEREVRAVLDRFTLQGAVPEPLKVARLLARSLLRAGF